MKLTRSRDAAPEKRASAVLVPDVSLTEPRIRIGDLLVQSGAVSREALENASHLGGEARIGSTLIEHGLLLEEDVTRALSEQLHVPVVDLRDAHPEPKATALVESLDAHDHDVLPLLYIDGILTVAIADPLDPDVISLLRSLPVDEVHVALGVPSQLRSSREPHLQRALRGQRRHRGVPGLRDHARADQHDRRSRRLARADRPGRQQDRHPGAA